MKESYKEQPAIDFDLSRHARSRRSRFCILLHPPYAKASEDETAGQAGAWRRRTAFELRNQFSRGPVLKLTRGSVLEKNVALRFCRKFHAWLKPPQFHITLRLLTDIAGVMGGDMSSLVEGFPTDGRVGNPIYPNWKCKR